MYRSTALTSMRSPFTERAFDAAIAVIGRHTHEAASRAFKCLMPRDRGKRGAIAEPVPLRSRCHCGAGAIAEPIQEPLWRRLCTDAHCASVRDGQPTAA